MTQAIAARWGRLGGMRELAGRPLSAPDSMIEEEREITIRRSSRQRVVFVSHCRREDRVRIISARKTTRGERKQYEEGIGEGN